VEKAKFILRFSFEDKRIKPFHLFKYEVDLIVGDVKKKRLAGQVK
jgi:hypothetical protein